MLKSLLLQLYVVAADFPKMLTRMLHPVSTQYLACFQRLKSTNFAPIDGASTQPDNGNDQLFLDDIPIFSKVANTKIPNLEKLAQAAMGKKSFNLYNKDTCMEFHELLCELLERFHRSLDDLKNLRKLTSGRRKQMLEPDLKAIMEQLHQVLALGRALRAIVRGSAIKMHLVTISPFLDVKTGKFWPMPLEGDTDFHHLKAQAISH